MLLTNPKKAKDFFDAKMEFTTGPIELNNMITQHENINIIDVRATEDYLKGHIPGAINLPTEQWHDLNALSYDRKNIIYCYSQVCHLAAAAAREFSEHGYPVMELEGGFQTWSEYNLPTKS